MDQLDLSDFFTTKAESLDFSARLSGISEQLYQTGFNLDDLLLSGFGIQKKDLFLSLLRNNNVNADHKEDLQNFFSLIIQKTASLPVVTLTLAFEPDNQTLKDLSQWFALNVDRQAVFEIIVDSKLIAGAAITYNGKYQDYSAAEKIQKIINETR